MIADLAMQRALDRYHRYGLASLTDEERTLATIWCFESKVANSGFERFYRSADGEVARYAPTAFRTVGAEMLARIAERANAVFGADSVPADQQLRAKIIQSMSDSARRAFDHLEASYAECAPDLDGYLETYLMHRPRVAD